jgi:integrase
VHDALEEVRGLLVDLFGLHLILQAGQIDLCVDLIGLVLPTEWEQVFISHAIGKSLIGESQKDRPVYRGRELETINFSGHGSPVSCKVYNKTSEIRQREKGEEVIEKPITRRFRLPRSEKKFIPTFAREDIEQLLAACEEGDKRKPQLRKALTARNRAIVSVLLDAGLRRSEIAGLRLGDIDRASRLLVVHRNVNKWQQVPISHDGFKPLHEYLTKHRPYLAGLAGSTIARKEDAVFLANDGEPLT